MEIKSSGIEQKFEGGAMRDAAAGKPQYHLLAPHMWPRLAPIWGSKIRDYLLTKNNAYLFRLEDDLVNDVGLPRLAEWLRLGAARYSEFNWARGMPLSRVLDSMGRHFLAHTQGVTDEDHGAASFCNVLFFTHYVLEMEAGRLDPKWNDLFDFNLYKPEKPDEQQ